MLLPDLRKHLQGLNGYCTRLLETAIGSCVNRGHYELRFEHLLSVSLDANDGDITEILIHFGINPGELKKALEIDLETLQNGNTGKPAFSPPLLETIERAWTLATLGFSFASISSGTLFAAYLERNASAGTAVSQVLRAINLQLLLAEYTHIVKLSTEQTEISSGTASPAHRAEGKSPTDTLSAYCVNFTQQARDGKIDEILGRDDEIRQAIDILSRRRKNNPIFVGEAGVGKTAVIEGLALRIAKNDVPESIRNVDIWGLDLGLLQAGASVKGEFEKRLKGVIEAIKTSATPVILFIDEAHTLIGAGGNAGMGDAANLLKPALARGEMKTMAATTWSEYRKYFEKDPALARRFQLVHVEEPDVERACAMLRGVANAFEKYHGVRITDDGVKAAVNYSHRYISGRQLPDKAVDVLDTACARVKMSQQAKPGIIDHEERALINANLAKNRLANDSAAGILTNSDETELLDEKIKTISATISKLTTQWEEEKIGVADLLAAQEEFRKLPKNDSNAAAATKKITDAQACLTTIAGESPMVFPYVNSAVCARVIADWTAIPIGSMMKDEAKTLLDLENILTSRVIGQDGALATLSDCIRSSKTGMGNPDAPLGVFLFSGPSGVGKTESALALADALFGGEKFTTIINMSEYQEKHTVSQLKGAPPGYVGYGEGGILTEAVRMKPYSVVILDEVEKAHLEVMNLFYQVFDKGFMRDGEGREINFRNTIIIMTSNLATDTIMDLATKEEPISDEALVDAIRPELSAHFRPALLARCTIIPYRPLSAEILGGIIRMKLDKIAKRIKATHHIAFTYSDSLVSNLALGCTASEAGARNAEAIIKSQLLPAISRQLLANLADETVTYTTLYVGENEQGEFSIVFSEDDGTSTPPEADTVALESL